MESNDKNTKEKSEHDVSIIRPQLRSGDIRLRAPRDARGKNSKA